MLCLWTLVTPIRRPAPILSSTRRRAFPRGTAPQSLYIRCMSIRGGPFMCSVAFSYSRHTAHPRTVAQNCSPCVGFICIKDTRKGEGGGESVCPYPCPPPASASASASASTPPPPPPPPLYSTSASAPSPPPPRAVVLLSPAICRHPMLPAVSPISPLALRARQKQRLATNSTIIQGPLTPHTRPPLTHDSQPTTATASPHAWCR